MDNIMAKLTIFLRISCIFKITGKLASRILLLNKYSLDCFKPYINFHSSEVADKFWWMWRLLRGSILYVSEVLLQLCIEMIGFGVLHRSLMPRSFVENNSNLSHRDKQERPILALPEMLTDLGNEMAILDFDKPPDTLGEGGWKSCM